MCYVSFTKAQAFVSAGVCVCMCVRVCSFHGCFSFVSDSVYFCVADEVNEATADVNSSSAMTLATTSTTSLSPLTSTATTAETVAVPSLQWVLSVAAAAVVDVRSDRAADDVLAAAKVAYVACTRISRMSSLLLRLLWLCVRVCMGVRQWNTTAVLYVVVAICGVSL